VAALGDAGEPPLPLHAHVPNASMAAIVTPKDIRPVRHDIV
jgi:hypothetical protein